MASLTVTLNGMPTRSQVAFKMLTILVQRDGADADPETVVRRSYALADEFLETARADWRDDRERVKKESAEASAKGDGGNDPNDRTQ